MNNNWRRVKSKLVIYSITIMISNGIVYSSPACAGYGAAPRLDSESDPTPPSIKPAVFRSVSRPRADVFSRGSDSEYDSECPMLRSYEETDRAGAVY